MKNKVIIACEQSQILTAALRRVGVEAYSCDILPTSGERHDWHIQGDVLPLLREEWLAVIAFPPCTYLTTTGNRWFNIERYGEKAIERHKKRQQAIDFFLKFTDLPHVPFVAIENPVGAMSKAYRQADQYIQPYWFGEPHSKKTGLWLKGLPTLKPTMIVAPEFITHSNGKRDPAWHYQTKDLPDCERSRQRSKLFQGIADAMAEQWKSYFL